MSSFWKKYWQNNWVTITNCSGVQNLKMVKILWNHASKLHKMLQFDMPSRVKFAKLPGIRWYLNFALKWICASALRNWTNCAEILNVPWRSSNSGGQIIPACLPERRSSKISRNRWSVQFLAWGWAFRKRSRRTESDGQRESENSCWSSWQYTGSSGDVLPKF